MYLFCRGFRSKYSCIFEKTLRIYTALAFRYPVHSCRHHRREHDVQNGLQTFCSNFLFNFRFTDVQRWGTTYTRSPDQKVQLRLLKYVFPGLNHRGLLHMPLGYTMSDLSVHQSFRQLKGKRMSPAMSSLHQATGKPLHHPWGLHTCVSTCPPNCASLDCRQFCRDVFTERGE